MIKVWRARLGSCYREPISGRHRAAVAARDAIIARYICRHTPDTSNGRRDALIDIDASATRQLHTDNLMKSFLDIRLSYLNATRTRPPLILILNEVTVLPLEVYVKIHIRM